MSEPYTATDVVEAREQFWGRLASLKIEDAAVHPDEMGDLSDEQYKRQLEAYYSTTGDLSVACSRQEIASSVLINEAKRRRIDYLFGDDVVIVDA